MFYTVYKITNNINNKIYIGAHKTSNLDDNYMGSGINIKRAISKYGIDNFSKEYIKVFDNPIDMFSYEKELVNEAFISREDTYNVNIGGDGGWDYVNSVVTTEQRIISGRLGNEAFKLLLATDEEFRERISTKHSVNTKNNHKLGKYHNFKYDWSGKTHSEETKKKIGAANSVKQAGEGNSQYGTMWIYNSSTNENKKIPKDDLDTWLVLGWIKGRKLKYKGF